jgi:hypothetical protein
MQHDAGTARGQERGFAGEYAVAMFIRPVGEFARAAEEYQAGLGRCGVDHRAGITRMGTANDVRGVTQCVMQPLWVGEIGNSWWCASPFRGVANHRNDWHAISQQRPAKCSAGAPRRTDDVDLDLTDHDATFSGHVER